MSTETIYLAEQVAAIDAAGATVTLRSTDGRGFNTRPADAPANAHFVPRIQRVGRFTRSVFGLGSSFGAGQIGFGDFALNNQGGDLDAWLDYSFDGRSFKLWRGPQDAIFPSGFTSLISGTHESAEFTTAEVRFALRDRMATIATPHCQSIYAGDNALPDGLEGVAGDLGGKRKPKLYGVAENVPPPMVNTSKLIYQLSDGAIKTVSAAYDRGSALTKGANYTDVTDMTTNAPAAGNYRELPGSGYFRLGSSPTGMLTCDATEGANAADRTLAQVFKRILLDRGVAAGDISAADLTQLDTDTGSAECGIWIYGDDTTMDALDRILPCGGAWCGQDRGYLWRVKQLKAPSASPAVWLDLPSELGLELQRTEDPAGGLPAWRITIGYERNWSPQAADLAGGVTDARRAFLKEEWRASVAADATVKNQYLSAQDLRFDTLLVSSAAAATEATRQLALRKVRRRLVERRVPMDAAGAAAIDIGAEVGVKSDRFWGAAGKVFVVLACADDYERDEIVLTLWG